MTTTATKKKELTIFDSEQMNFHSFLDELEKQEVLVVSKPIKEATIFEQTDLFDFLDELEEQNIVTVSKVTAQPFFTLNPGTVIYLNHWVRDKYQVVSDDGETTICRRIYERYYDDKVKISEEETVVKSKDVYAIAEPILIPLPRIHRKADLNLDEFKNKQQEFITSMSEEMKMDMITYVLALSNNHYYTDQFLRAVHENKKEWAGSILNSGSSYINTLGSQGTMQVQKTYNQPFQVSYGDKLSLDAESYEETAIVEHFTNLLERVNTKSTKEMNVFELILHYRLNGLKLKYMIETDEWWISHPYSSRLMPIEGGREQLNDLQQVSEAYETFSVLEKKKKKNTAKQKVEQTVKMFDSLGETENTIAPVKEAKGFKLPSGVVAMTDFDNNYQILSDNGEFATAVKVKRYEISSRMRGENDLESLMASDDIVTIKSSEFTRAYVSEHHSVALPSYHRPSDLTLEEIRDRGVRHYGELSEKEATDLAVIRWTGTSNSSSDGCKFLRSYHENDLKRLEALLKERTSGSYSGCVSTDQGGGKFKLSLKTTNPMEIVLNTSQAIRHFEGMMENIQTKQSKELSLYELQLAYRLKGYLLEYCPERQEYRLSHIHGARKAMFCKGRYDINSIDESIQKLEDWIAVC